MSTETQAPSVAMVTLTIDGREVQVPKGTNVIEAARKLGIDIPYLCYHHQLTSFGGCRLCLVEIEKVPKLLAACNTTVADGMVVRTTTEKVRQQRSGSLEFILLNHPLDCPVCDKGGECELQDRVFEHSNALSRMTEPKIHIEDYDLGPLVVRNQDRCIICKRCVKVMEEIAGEPVLEFGQRGVTTEVYTFEHGDFKPGFSGNTIRVCPVGALMSKPFRFKARPWELAKAPGICTLCSVGCNVREDVRENRLMRVVGLENPHVNDGWLCDRGQFGYDYINSPQRLTAPMIRRENGEFEEVAWDEALTYIAGRLREVDGAAFGAIGSERLSNEDAFTLQRFTREVMGSPNLDHRMGSTRTSYQAARPQPGAIESLPSADVVLLIGTDLTADAPVLDLVLKRSVLPKKAKLIVAHPRETGLDKFASLRLRYTPGQEIAVLNALAKALVEEGLVPDAVKSSDNAGWTAVNQGLASTVSQLAGIAGLTEADVRAAAKLFGGAKLGSILFGQEVVDARDGQYLVAAVQNLSILSGHGSKPGHVAMEAVQNANTWGARDMGVLPDAGPAGTEAQRGLSTGEMLQAAGDGRLKALFVAGANPVVEFAGAAKARRALERVPFLVVQDMFLHETARLAHVVLPTTSVAERNAAYTNVEGRVQRVVRAMSPRGAAKDDWAILDMLSDELGKPMGFTSVDAVAKEIRAARDAAAPAPAAKLQRVETPQPPATEATYPLRLFTGKLLFDRSTIQRESTVLPGLAPDPFVELNAADAQRLGVSDGDRVLVTTAYGKLELAARVTGTITPGSAFVPSGYCEAPAGELWTEESRVVPCSIVPASSAAA